MQQIGMMLHLSYVYSPHKMCIMKTTRMFLLSILSVLLVMSSFSSCVFFFWHHDDDIKSVGYQLDLSFQDASGKDLVSGIGVEMMPAYGSSEPVETNYVRSDLYELKVVASKACEDVLAATPRNYIPSGRNLGLNSVDGYTFLTTHHYYMADKCPDERVLTYKLKCPYVFGNHVVREVVTYWEIPKMRDGGVSAICKRITFEGEEITPIASQDGYTYKAVIVLEGIGNQ